MTTKQFAKTDLQELLCDECETLTVIRNEMYDTSRWSIWYDLIFKENETDKLYQTSYSRGATECQDESPWEYDGDMIDCHEVEKYEKTIIEYRPIKS